MNYLIKLNKLAFLILFPLSFFTQNVSKSQYNWYNNNGYALNTDLAYKKVLKGKESKPVIVAIIDSGVDVEHEDLKTNIWVNKDEIPNNNIDDDNNGFIDDVNGWNFLGNSNGENLNDVRLELSRLYATLSKKFKDLDSSEIEKNLTQEYSLFIEVKQKYEKKRNGIQSQVESFNQMLDMMSDADSILKVHFKGNYVYKDLKKLKKDHPQYKNAQKILSLRFFGLSFSSFKGQVKYFQKQLEYNYNAEIDPRAEIIGDDVSNIKDDKYGNNNVEGPDASHGTHCAGIIGAVRGNGIGNDGVAQNVKLMSVRAVPNGDEWDKDIALAIRYAVDNGANIVNMSFGKAYSPEKQMVIDAVRYAEENDVLLVHAAGNSSLNNDNHDHFPTPIYPTMKEPFKNWIEVGASTRFGKPKFKKGVLKRVGLAARFSNYGAKSVDIFAPGHDIYSTIPDNKYDLYNGTSMAAPMVSGLAALLKSYYPNYTMLEIKNIILKSAKDYSDFETVLPGSSSEEVTFDKLCSTAGVANVYNAVLLAEKRLK